MRHLRRRGKGSCADGGRKSIRSFQDSTQPQSALIGGQRGAQYVDSLCLCLDQQGLIGPDVHLHLYANPDADYLTDEFLTEADACLARAEIAAEDDDALERVRVLRLSTRYAIMCRMKLDDPAREAYMDAFERDVKAAGIETFYWRQLPDKAMEYIRRGDMRFGH